MRSKQSRREFLTSALALAGASTLEGCQEDLGLFYQNFDQRGYTPFKDAERPVHPENRPLSNDQFRAIVASIFNGFSSSFPMSTHVVFSFDEAGIHADRIADTEAQGFTIEQFDTPSDGTMQLTFTDANAPDIHVTVSASLDALSFQERVGSDLKRQVTVVLDKNVMTHDGVSACVMTQQEAGEAPGDQVSEDATNAGEQPNERVVTRYFNGDGTVTTIENASLTVVGTDNVRYTLNGTDAVIAWLRTDPTTAAIRQVFTAGRKKSLLKDIQHINQLTEIFRLTSKDPSLHSSFLRFALTFEGKDRSHQDEFRNPIDAIQSGWGDCDDHTVINYFWSHLNGYHPEVFDIGKDHLGHVFMWYLNTERLTVVLDNSSSIMLEKGKTVQDYVHEHYPGWRTYNDKFGTDA